MLELSRPMGPIKVRRTGSRYGTPFWVVRRCAVLDRVGRLLLRGGAQGVADRDVDLRDAPQGGRERGSVGGLPKVG